VLHRAAAVVNGHEVALALVGVVHLVLQETQVDLGRNEMGVLFLVQSMGAPFVVGECDEGFLPLNNEG
jgi:hypothetical protein